MTANLVALTKMAECRKEGRHPTPEEQALMAQWSGWGALPEVFDDESTRWRGEREMLRELLGSDKAWAAARASTINAHYTSVPVVEAMWATAQDLGFSSGRVLEPGCGVGNFLGFAPDGTDLVGVELDPTTAELARMVYGARATVHTGGFERFEQPEGSFDLVIGNVPFAQYKPHDPQYNRAKHSLHNYFLLKSLHLTRPGGLVLALTSQYTLDARNPSSRRALAGLADLVGAVRFPNKEFQAVAGTDVIEDLLVLRRRPDGEAPSGPEWEETVPIAEAGVDYHPGPDDEPVAINRYLAEHPERVLGRLEVGSGQYRRQELTVERLHALTPHRDALRALVEDARARGATMSPAPPPGERPARERMRLVEDAAGEWDTRYAQEGSFVVSKSGMIGRYRGGKVALHAPAAAARATGKRGPKGPRELHRLVRLRDAARHVLALQLADATDAEVHEAQGVLTSRYQDYVRRHGPLNRYTVAWQKAPNRKKQGPARADDRDLPGEDGALPGDEHDGDVGGCRRSGRRTGRPPRCL